jgi:hypothetical protein
VADFKKSVPLFGNKYRVAQSAGIITEEQSNSAVLRLLIRPGSMGDIDSIMVATLLNFKIDCLSQSLCGRYTP